MPPKRAPSPDPTKKRLIKRKVNPAGQRTPREEQYVERTIGNIILAEHRVSKRISDLQTMLERLQGTPHDNHDNRSKIIAQILRWLRYKAKLDNDYGHWDAIIDNGYDRDDPDDYNYPPPPPPPPSLTAPS